MSPPILPADPKQMPEGNRLCVLRPGTRGEWQRTGGELQCRGMAGEDAKAQASDRRETTTSSQNVNSDLKCVYSVGKSWLEELSQTAEIYQLTALLGRRHKTCTH